MDYKVPQGLGGTHNKGLPAPLGVDTLELWSVENNRKLGNLDTQGQIK